MALAAATNINCSGEPNEKPAHWPTCKSSKVSTVTPADAIIEAQRREIKEMNWLINDIAENGKATTQAEAEARPVPASEATP